MGPVGGGVAGARALTFPLIDILRGFAALSVVVYHVIAHFEWTGFPIAFPLVWFRIGWIGVDLFFVISGFVIALSAFARLRSGGTVGFHRGFARARLARIVPLYYLTCLIFLAFIQPELWFTADIVPQLLTHALFVHSWFIDHQGAINGVNWSVAVEMQFYVLMLLIAPWLRRAHWAVILVGGVAVAWAWRAAVFYAISSTGAQGPFPVFVYTTELPGMLDEFAMGILLARFVISARGEALLAWARRFVWVLPLVTTGVVWVAFQIYWWNAVYWDSAAMVIGFKSLMAIACGMVLLSACALGFAPVVRWTLPLRYLGTISFGIYLWHLPVILSLHRLPWLTAPRALPLVLGLTVLFASMSWHLFERPLMRRYGSTATG